LQKNFRGRAEGACASLSPRASGNRSACLASLERASPTRPFYPFTRSPPTPLTSHHGFETGGSPRLLTTSGGNPCKIFFGGVGLKSPPCVHHSFLSHHSHDTGPANSQQEIQPTTVSVTSQTSKPETQNSVHNPTKPHKPDTKVHFPSHHQNNSSHFQSRRPEISGCYILDF